MKYLSKEQVTQIMAHYGNDPQQLAAVLLDIQRASGKNFVEKQWAELVSAVLDVPLSKVFDMIGFYAMLSTEPQGEYIIEICKSTPCYFSGGDKVTLWFEEAAGIKMGETTADGKLSLVHSSCFGACDISPAVKINDDVFGNLTPDKVKTLVQYCLQGKDLQPLCQK